VGLVEYLRMYAGEFDSKSGRCVINTGLDGRNETNLNWALVTF